MYCLPMQLCLSLLLRQPQAHGCPAATWVALASSQKLTSIKGAHLIGIDAYKCGPCRSMYMWWRKISFTCNIGPSIRKSSQQRYQNKRYEQPEGTWNQTSRTLLGSGNTSIFSRRPTPYDAWRWQSSLWWLGLHGLWCLLACC